MIEGNTVALIQVQSEIKQNSIGEAESEWVDVASLKGLLDLSGGDSKRTVYNAKIQESTHLFICDYQNLKNLSGGWIWDTLSFVDGIISDNKLKEKVNVTSENSRMIINNYVYDIMLIDDPMNLHQQLEIYLKYTGGQNGRNKIY